MESLAETRTVLRLAVIVVPCVGRSGGSRSRGAVMAIVCDVVVQLIANDLITHGCHVDADPVSGVEYDALSAVALHVIRLEQVRVRPRQQNPAAAIVCNFVR